MENDHLYDVSYGRGQLQSASCMKLSIPVTDRELEMRCLDPTTLEPVSPQQKSHPQSPLQYMPLQEAAHGSDQQHLTNNQAPLLVLQNNPGCYGAGAELVESATDFTANPSDQDMDFYSEMKYSKSNHSFDEFRIQQPATQPKGLVDNIADVSALPEFQTSAQQTKDNDVEQPIIIFGPTVEYVTYEGNIFWVIPPASAQQTNNNEARNELSQHFTSGMGETDAQVHPSTVSEIGGTSNLEDNPLWVKLKKPGEGLKQFLRKNWSEMLRHLPIPRPKNRGRTYKWQEEEPEDPAKIKKWLNAIKQKYWRVMQVKAKLPTTETEGLSWQQTFIAICEQTR
ncbi:uncharacterized protein LOC125036246 [Penaeus chinensis]|uniref:uncharacterized protein LOC125036246 n=1 Tax=Penaeus chinensis TaxID=139456 RepID=UPI001FB65E98|nr:uncharacterized protein LOC125036246 [Penaeus chinensis]